MDVVVATSGVNRYGYRINIAGLDTSSYKNNPVLLYMHGRGEEKLPIGRVENLRIDGDRMLGTPVFDEEDDFALKVKRKWEKKFLNAASVWIEPTLISEDPKDLLPGQYRPTVLEAELMEISIVDIPGDRNAVRLSHSDGEDLDDILPKLSIKKTSKKMDKKIYEALGLAEGATPEAAVAAIEKLKVDAGQATAAQANAVQMLLALGKSKGIVNDENQGNYERLAKADFEAVQKLFAGAVVKPEEPKPQGDDAKDREPFTLSAFLNEFKKLGGGQGGDENRDNWSFDDWSKKDPKGLLKMKREDSERYDKLAAEYADA